MKPEYKIETIKASVDEVSYRQGVTLYKRDKVTKFQTVAESGYYAKVLGRKPYNVLVSAKNCDRGGCTCYLGQRDILCKHMVAVAIAALIKNSPTEIDLLSGDSIGLSLNSRRGELSQEELLQSRWQISLGLRKIKCCNSYSTIQSYYQNSLIEGCNKLRTSFNSIPVSPQTCYLVVITLIKIDKKLKKGINDADNTVRNFMQESVDFLALFAQKDTDCLQSFKKLKNIKTSFQWQKPLLKLLKPK